MIFTVLIAAGLVLAQAEHTVFTTELPMWDALAADVNGDGFKDILVYCSDDEAEVPTKELCIFLAGPKGRFDAATTIRYPLPATNGTAFVCEFDGAPPQEIVFFDHASARVMRLKGNTLEEVCRMEVASLLPTGTREPVFLREGVRDLDGDGRDEWLLPLADGYGIFSGGKLRAKLPAPITSELRDYSNFQISHRLPAVATFALPGEKLRAVALLSDTQADFSHGEEWREHVRYTIPRRLDKKWDASAELEDINADGLPDLVVTQTSGTINLKTETQIYLATGPFQYPAAPDARVAQSGSFTTATLRDANRDKKLDLIFVSVPLGIGNIINYFLRQKVTVDASVYEFGEKGFPVKPNRKTSLTVDAPEGREHSSYALGDFDGDGYLDAAVGSGAQMLSFYRGSSREFLSAGAWVKIAMPTFGVARTGDLDGNGKDDLLLIHPGGPNEKRLDVVMF